MLALVPGFRMTMHLDAQPIAAIDLMVVGCLAVGHMLGGRTCDERTGLAIASVARNIGLALFICALSGIEKQIIPTLLSYMILGAIVAVPYSVWCKRQMVQIGEIEHGVDSTV
jgi:BASS family bile acid:Na+ symporter